jgi:hypothetical protein
MADRTSAAADNAAWYNAINDLSRERGLGFEETDINGLITDSKRRGKSLADVLRRLDRRYPAKGTMPGTTESTTPTAVASGTQPTSVFVPPPAPADDARRGSSSPFTPAARDADARENASAGARTPRRSDSRGSFAQPSQPLTSGHHLRWSRCWCPWSRRPRPWRLPLRRHRAVRPLLLPTNHCRY